MMKRELVNVGGNLMMIKEPWDEGDTRNNGMEARKKHFEQWTMMMMIMIMIMTMMMIVIGQLYGIWNIFHEMMIVWICLQNFFLFSPVFNYSLPACSRAKLWEINYLDLSAACTVFVFVLVVYLWEINYPNLSDCLYLLWPGRDVIKISIPDPIPVCTAQCYFYYQPPLHLVYGSSHHWYL